MKTLDFARAQIRFDKSSPITGPFRDEFYANHRRCPKRGADNWRAAKDGALASAKAEGVIPKWLAA
jgi:hypothetical protein